MLACKLRLHHVRIGRFFVDFIDSNDNFCMRRPGKANRFNRLRFHAVVCGHDNNHYVRKGSAVLTQCREGFVTWRIEQRHHTSVTFSLIRTDMLSNSTSFVVHGFLPENRVEQTGFTMVDMTHNRHDWRARYRMIG